MGIWSIILTSHNRISNTECWAVVILIIRSVNRTRKVLLHTIYYTSVSEPLGGTYYHNRDYYIIPVKVTHEVYTQLMRRNKKEHNNNHKHDRRYFDVEKYYRQRGEIDEDDKDTNAWECVAERFLNIL